MIKTLQKKFILSAMLAITILLTILLGAINIGNAYVSRQQNEQMVRLLLDEETMMHPMPRDNKPKGFWTAPMDENSRMSALYFTVRIDQNENMIKIDTSRIASVSEEEAIEICRSVIDKGLDEGKIQNFRFKTAVSERDNSKVFLFLDTTVQLRNTLYVLFFSLIAGLGCWAAMLLLIVLLSKKAIRPIAENLAKQKQFVTDAGHELKTPLAIILANTEAMELYQGESKWSKNIREQTVRLNGLMQNLLTLAKADESRDMIQTQIFSLSSAVEEGLQMFREPMKLKELSLCSQIDPDITMTADKEQIGRLLSILIDNAVKYSVQKGTVDISLKQHSNSIVFRIENVCEKLPDCEPEKLFDRFYRADAARTQKNGGYGIGLSAARTIAEMYKGTIRASYQQPEKIIFMVTF